MTCHLCIIIILWFRGFTFCWKWLKGSLGLSTFLLKNKHPFPYNWKEFIYIYYISIKIWEEIILVKAKGSYITSDANLLLSRKRWARREHHFQKKNLCCETLSSEHNDHYRLNHPQETLKMGYGGSLGLHLRIPNATFCPPIQPYAILRIC